MAHDEVTPVNPSLKSNDSYPLIGESVEGLRSYLVREGRLKDSEFTRVREDAVSIIRDCVRFDGPDATRTGLVVGYVQSGKTMSMTAVSALARDNGCRIVIQLAGVTNLLLKQSFDRFRNDLREAAGRPNSWRFFNSTEGFGQTQIRTLQQAALDWRDPLFKDDQQTLMFVVLKHHAHLDELHDLLTSVSLKGVPALILDDEADQAGLNTQPGEEEGSTIYRRIIKLRSALPHHTYLQYTATPQAPLLIALDDMLSPAFAELVRPGEGYTGGQSFFGVGSEPKLVQAIPEDDLFKAGEPPTEVPASLVRALRVFFVGCAIAASRGAPSVRSMLVHPSQRNLDHARYINWVSEATKRWVTALRSTEEIDRKDAIDEFRPAYNELLQTDKQLPPFDDDLVKRMVITMTRVSITEVNSQEGVEIDWKNAADHILVGGEKLNRGYTVDGLTVTYMPRGTGGWNADTIQQRARFFGYKSKYLNLCRLYLHPDVIDAFRSYVRHEQDIRSQLADHRGQPLRNWRRAFFLDARMRPTRQNVLLDPYYKISKEKLWFVQRYPHEANKARNASLVGALEKSLTFEDDEEFYQHPIAEMGLKELYEKILVDYDVRGNDVQTWYGQLVTIGDIVGDNPNARVVVVKMMGAKGARTREREPNKGGDINIHQGPSSKKSDPNKYPGDNKIFDEEHVTIQLHQINVKGGISDVPAIAVHIPAALRKDDVGVQLRS
jgi:hypothetical protein